MRIRRVSAFGLESALPYAYGISTGLQTHRRALLVQVVADTGLEGWGEGSGEVAAFARLVNERIGPPMLGGDATDVDGFYAWMRESWPDALSAVGAVDTALGDLRARASGRSLVRDLGPDLCSAVPAYAAGGYYPEGRVDRGQQLAAAAQAYVAQGFCAVKVKIGRLSVAEDAAALRRLRAEVGPDVRVLTDANEGYGDDLKRALEMAETLSDIDAYWFEEPLSTDHPELYARLRAAIPVPVVGGEHLAGVASYARLLEAGAYDVVQPDVTITGGVSGYRRFKRWRSGMACTAPRMCGARRSAFTPVCSWWVRLAQASPKRCGTSPCSNATKGSSRCALPSVTGDTIIRGRRFPGTVSEEASDN